MKICKFMLMIALVASVSKGFAQESQVLPPPVVLEAISDDDSVKLATFVTKDNVNECYGKYSILSHAVRIGSMKCFDFLIGKGADVNKVCDGYVPPLMHAAKYGRLEMAKKLIARGADAHYKYNGQQEDLIGETPLSYAQKFQKDDMVLYLKSLK